MVSYVVYDRKVGRAHLPLGEVEPARLASSRMVGGEEDDEAETAHLAVVVPHGVGPHHDRQRCSRGRDTPKVDGAGREVRKHRPDEIEGGADVLRRPHPAAAPANGCDSAEHRANGSAKL